MSLPELGTFPHCDQAVLHAPGECRYCDAHPEWQALRRGWGIAFTGHEPTPPQSPCPSDFRRGIGQAHVWGGNRPTNVDAPQEETFASKVMYGPVGVSEAGQADTAVNAVADPDPRDEELVAVLRFIEKMPTWNVGGIVACRDWLTANLSQANHRARP